MFFFSVFFILPLYLMAPVRLLAYLYRGREVGGWIVALLVDLCVIIGMPWYVLTELQEGTVNDLFRGGVLVITAAYFWVSYRKRAQAPVPEFLLQLLIALGVGLNVGLIIGEPFAAIGTLPVICLFILALEKAHRAVIGNAGEVLDLPGRLDVLDDFTGSSSSAGPEYGNAGGLARFLAGPRVLVYTVLLVSAAFILIVLFHLGLLNLYPF